jgi:hypothetical protein
MSSGVMASFPTTQNSGNGLRSLQEQKKAWIKETGKINTRYSRRLEIMRGYFKVKNCSKEGSHDRGITFWTY